MVTRVWRGELIGWKVKDSYCWANINSKYRSGRPRKITPWICHALSNNPIFARDSRRCCVKFTRYIKRPAAIYSDICITNVRGQREILNCSPLSKFIIYNASVPAMAVIFNKTRTFIELIESLIARKYGREK